MKKLVSILVMVLCALSISAQGKEVTKFLGIPVDGTKAEMRKKLIEKGFTPRTLNGDEHFEGEFNGHNVNVFIVTNNNKVYRIMIADKNTLNEANIKIRFNTLCRQFENNKRYYSFESQTINDEEDISYEMAVNDKIYEAVYFQLSDKPISTEDPKEYTTELYYRQAWFRISNFQGEYYLTMYYDNKYNEANGEDL